MTLPHVELDPDGVPIRATIASQSRPGESYVLERSRSGRWMHTDSRCPGWTNNTHCYHVSALEALTMALEEENGTTAIAIREQQNVLAQIDALDEQAVIQRLTGGLPEVTQKWVYSFPSGGTTVTGLSIDGVQEAARHLATQGEAIEQVWVHLDSQTEDEAYFTACAVRYAVSPDGRRVELDRAIRAKRQPKYIKLRNGGTQFNEFWYEIGAAKALRNAVEALLPEAIKQHMIKAAGKARTTSIRESGEAPTQEQRRASQHRVGKDSTARPEQPNPKTEINALVRRVRDECDPETIARVMDYMREVGAYAEDGTPQLSALSLDEATKARDTLKKLLDGDGPPAAEDGAQGRLDA